MPNKTVLFHTSENCDLMCMYRELAIRELHMQGVKFSTTCNDTEGHTTSAKGQGTEIEYMRIKQLDGIECLCMCREQV